MPTTAWRELSACRGVKGSREEKISIFFDPIQSIAATLTPAQSLCRTCVVRQACLDYASRNRIVDGTWGGVTGKRALERARREYVQQESERQARLDSSQQTA